MTDSSIEERPSFAWGDVQPFVERHFFGAVELVKSLPSERDLNFLVKLDEELAVFKARRWEIYRRSSDKSSEGVQGKKSFGNTKHLGCYAGGLPTRGFWDEPQEASREEPKPFNPGPWDSRMAVWGPKGRLRLCGPSTGDRLRRWPSPRRWLARSTIPRICRTSWNVSAWPWSTSPSMVPAVSVCSAPRARSFS